MMAKSYEERRRELSGALENDGAYSASREALQRAEASRPEYAGSYEDELKDAYRRILEMERFRYDSDDDALYRQFADRYMNAGKLAMRDSMGRASSLTGGYGSSYGQAAGQQAYDAYLQDLGDRSLELYDRAYSRYRDEADALRDEYSLLSDMAGDEYGRYADALRQYNADRDYASAAEEADWSRAYELDREAWERSRDEAGDEYDRQLDFAQTLAAYGDFSGYAELFGGDRAAGMQLVWNAGNFDLAYNSGKITAEEYRAMTGKWPKGYKKGGGGTAKNSTDGNRYEALQAQLRLLEAGGSSAQTIQGKIEAAYSSGAITKKQREQLTGEFSGSSGNAGSVKKPGASRGLLA